MVFRITIKDNINLAKLKVYFNARRTIALFPKGPAELELDKYLIEKYKTNLQLMCLKLLQHIKIMDNSENEIVITFTENKYDKIASLITYGNEKLKGSKILTTAFMR